MISDIKKSPIEYDYPTKDEFTILTDTIMKLDPIDLYRPDTYDVDIAGLFSSIINRALLDVIYGNHVIKKDALAWLESTSKHPWSFKWICEQINLNHKLIRNKIFNTQKTHHKSIHSVYYKIKRFR